MATSLPPPPTGQALQNPDGSVNSVWNTWFNQVTNSITPTGLTTWGVLVGGPTAGSPIVATAVGALNKVFVGQGSALPIYKDAYKLPGGIAAAVTVTIGVGTATVVSSFNVSSVTWSSAGLVQVNFNLTISNPIAVACLADDPGTPGFVSVPLSTLASTNCTVLIENSVGTGINNHSFHLLVCGTGGAG